MSEIVKPAHVIPVLKADAYGLGAREIGRYLSKKGIKITAVADIGEAFILKDLFSEIQILGAVFDDEVSEILKNGWICPVTSVTRLKAWQKILKSQTKKLRVQLYLDTGMGQLGLTPEGVMQAFEIIKSCSQFELVGLYSHFSDGDKKNDIRSKQQLAIFNSVKTELIAKGAKLQYIHIGNSSAINNMPSSYKNFSHIRTGINLYGVQSVSGSMAKESNSVIKLTSRVISVRQLVPGESIGYLHTFTAKKNMVVATIPAGYADGIPFGAKNTGHVLIQGTKCKILGRISMDYLTVNVSHLPNILVGDLVVLIGRQGQKEITVEDWAKLRQSIPYEVICSLNTPRIVREYSQ